MEIKRVDIKKLSKSACSRVPCAKCGVCFDADRDYVWYNEKNGNRVCYDCAEKYYGVRKERVEWIHSRQYMRKILLASLINLGYKATSTYVCGTCEREFAPTTDYIWVIPEGNTIKKREIFICDECAEAKVTYRQQYGFWLRGLMSEHFIPCENCQDRLHKMMMTLTVAFYTQECITIETVEANGKIVWQFLLRFFTCIARGLSNKQVFRPCEKCQKKLQNLWETKELHIGTENKPPVELWRKMNQVIPELDK